MTPRREPQSPAATDMTTRTLAFIVWLSIGLSLALMIARAVFAISFEIPLFVPTSGAEEESSFALWKYVHDQSIYQDPFRIPFTASYYNWLFYVVYGGILRTVQTTAQLQDAWLPTIGRFVSLAFAGMGTLVAFLTIRDQAPSGRSDPYRMALAWSIFLFFGPLIGFWALSLNPELPAMVLAGAGTLVFLRRYRKHPYQAAVLATLFSYAAWSFKQTHVFLGGALVLFLLLRWDWKNLALVVVLHGLTIALTLAAGSPDYRLLVMWQNTDITFASWQLFRNLVNFSVKTAPVLVATGYLVYRLAVSRTERQNVVNDDRTLFALCGVLFTAVLSIPASAKIGAAENYYFTLAYFLTLTVGMASASASQSTVPRLLVSGAWAVNALAILTVLGGWNGVISVRSWHKQHVQEKQCLMGLPTPLYSADPYLSLPWMTPEGPYFITAFNYLADRRAGRSFERNGIGGLISEGYFGTLMVGHGTTDFDGASFDKYVLKISDCVGRDIYVRAR